MQKLTKFATKYLNARRQSSEITSKTSQSFPMTRNNKKVDNNARKNTVDQEAKS